MDERQRRQVLRALEDIQQYVRIGGEVEHGEPEPRGRKGPDRSHHRFVTFKVVGPARFDSMRWKAMVEERRETDTMPAPTKAQQAQVAILRAVAYRLTHPNDQHPCSWWQEAPRQRTTRITVDIDTADLHDLIARITHTFIGRQPKRDDALRPGKSEPLPPQPRR